MNHIIQIIIAKLLVMAIALGIQAILARALGPDGRGAYEACLLFGATLMLAFNPGVETSPVFYISSGRVSFSEGTYSALALASIVGGATLIAGIAIVGVQPQILAAALSKASPVELLLGVAAAISGMFAQVVQGLLTIRHRFGAYSLSQVIQRATALSLVLIFVTGCKTAVNGAIVSIVLADLVLFVCMLEWMRRNEQLVRTPPIASTLRLYASYGARFYFGKISNQMNFRLGPVVLAFIATRAELGLYGQASAIAIQFMTIPDALYTVLVPRMSRSDEDKAEITAQAGRVIAYMGAIAVTVGILISRPVFAFLFSSTFLPAVPVFKVLLAAFACRAFGKSYEPYLLGANRPGAISIAVSCGLAVNVVMFAVLYRSFGILGAAWSLAANYAVSTVILVAAFSGISRMPLPICLLPRRSDLRILNRIRADRRP